MKRSASQDHLAWLREGKTLSTAQQLRCIIQLSIPAIFAHLSSVVMQYIDASMVGQLGKTASASIGLVSSSTWLVGGITCALGTGFTVQIAHRIGAKQEAEARAVVRHGLLSVLVFSLFMGLLSASLAGVLPIWLGGQDDLLAGSTQYFRIYSLALPAMAVNYAAGGMLQCSGNMRTPSMINIIMCALDVLLNALLIFPARTLSLGTLHLPVPGFHLGVAGAALGTAFAEIICAALMLYFLLVRSDTLNLRHRAVPGNFSKELQYAVRLSLPIAIENAISGGAQVTSTRIVAPLGTVAIAANSFSVTAEGVCYMPGYGIASAATALIGQSTGAGRKKETKKLSFLTIGLGMAVMTGTGILLYIFAPQMLGILTPDSDIQNLGVQVLRIEAFAEPFFAASIVTAGVFRGVGKTAVSTMLNLGTMWLIRIPLAALLAPRLGLQGVWTAMCLQLTVCGLLFLLAAVLHFRKAASQKNISR
ncbi:MAG: MATE family efflux transporter [Eubacteriales bacterium]|nr:MATE family efflux transporter [Eubacteriales bacterium]